MKCPMSANQYGTMSLCSATRCAWWDATTEQCCIKTFCSSNTKEKIIKERVDSFTEAITRV